MAHDLEMRNPERVLTRLDDAIDVLKKMEGTIETMSQIGDMNLKIGGLDKTFKNLISLNPSVDGAEKVFASTKESIENHVKVFAQKNEDITF